ncbi:MAG: histidine phosphatase family protein [Thermoleophilaceae bacterium]
MILLARHGETDWNVPPARVMGSVDIPLNARGREQARGLAAEAGGVAALYASPLARARETAAIVGAELGLEPLLDERLAESDRGAWEGRRLSDIEREEPDAWAAWRAAGDGFRFPGGESLGEHAARVGAALDAIAAGPLPALAICHGGTIRAAVAARHERGLDAFHELDVPNARVVRL